MLQDENAKIKILKLKKTKMLKLSFFSNFIIMLSMNRKVQ